MANLYLMRHGEAEMGSLGQADRDRALTANGRKQVERQALRLFVEASEIRLILHSPYLRAFQTAEILQKTLSIPLQSSEDLIPDAHVIRATQLVVDQAEPILVVSHLPLVAELAEEIVSRHPSFATATCIKILREGQGRRGVLDWIQNP